MTDKEYGVLYRSLNKEREKERKKQWREQNALHCAEYQKQHYLKNRDAYLQKEKERRSTKAGKLQRILLNRKYRVKYPIKYRARDMLNDAIRRGKITRHPCYVCGSSINVHGHHEDYLKPLEVIWLCVRHHQERHKEAQSHAKVMIVGT